MGPPTGALARPRASPLVPPGRQGQHKYPTGERCGRRRRALRAVTAPARAGNCLHAEPGKNYRGGVDGRPLGRGRLWGAGTQNVPPPGAPRGGGAVEVVVIVVVVVSVVSGCSPAPRGVPSPSPRGGKSLRPAVTEGAERGRGGGRSTSVSSRGGVWVARFEGGSEFHPPRLRAPLSLFPPRPRPPQVPGQAET